MKVWKIEKLGDHYHEHKGKLFAKRERAESIAQKLAEEMHKRHSIDMVDEAKKEYMGKEADDWWLAGPKMCILKEKNLTFYGVGQADWSERDRRSAQYFWVIGVKVTE